MNTEETTEYLRTMHEGYEASAAEAFAEYEATDDLDEPDRSDKLDEAIEKLDGLNYGFEIERHVSITLAGGGPSLWLDATLDRDGDVTAVEAHASWASTPVVTRIDPDSALWRYAERYVEYAVESERERIYAESRGY